MNKHIYALFNEANQQKILLRKEADKLGFNAYIGGVIKELKSNKKISQDSLCKLEKRQAKSIMKGGAMVGIHPNQYADVNNYSVNPTGESPTKVDFNNFIARPAIMGGCAATPLFNDLQATIRKELKGKGVSTSAITSVCGMATHRIITEVTKMNKSNRLKKMKG